VSATTKASLAAWLLAASGAASGIVAAQAPPDPSAGDAATRRVEAIVRNEPRVAPAEQAAQLVALGDAAIPALVALRLGQPLPSADGELALVALRALPAAPVDACLVDVVASGDDPRRAVEVVRIVGELGRASALDTLARATAAMEPPLQGNPIVAGTLRQAVAALAAAGPLADARLASFLLALPEPLAAAGLEAIAAEQGNGRTALWCDLVGRRDALDRALLAELELRPPLDPKGFERAGRLLRERAVATEVEQRRLVARALRRYPSLDSASTLVELMADPDLRVREVAHRSLAELSGVTLPADRAAWCAWRDDEAAWRRDAWKEIEESLGSLGEPELLRLLASLARKKVHADVLAPPVGALLRHERREVRLAAGEALGRFATPDCLEPLRRAATEGDAELKTYAGRLLARAGATR